MIFTSILAVVTIAAILFSNRQDQKIASGDVKAAAGKVWFAAVFAVLWLGMGVYELTHPANIAPRIRDWGMVVFCTYKSVELWQNVRRMKEKAGHL